MPLTTSSDPLDFSGKYNTPLPASAEPTYQRWAKQNGQDPNRGKYDYDLQGAFLGGAGTAGNGHLPDTYKKPNHPTFSDESQYHGIDGYLGGKWTAGGYQPSSTNLQFRPHDQLQQYFNRVEPGTPLLAPVSTPVPTGTHGNYTVSDLAGNTPYRPPGPQNLTPRSLLAPQPQLQRKYYGQ